MPEIGTNIIMIPSLKQYAILTR